MIDHLLGRPSAALKRTQVFLVLLFWTLTLLSGNKNGPPLVRWFSKRFRARLTPWQVLTGTLTCLYAVKNIDSILGLPAPEPLARLYSRDFYRATWIVTALDTGFATAMHVRPKWLRDVLSLCFSGYYLLFANEADEKLRKYRAVCTVEMLRSTWEKTSNPIIRAVTFGSRPTVKSTRRILLPRPAGSPYNRPLSVWLYYDGSDTELAACAELWLDIPGGGFVCMGPVHHEERILSWARRTKKPVLAVEYSKAPEYPYPYAMHEVFDLYRLLHETKGSVIGMKSGELRIVMSGDSAGANIGAAVMIKLLEMPAASRPPLPLSLIWTYPALDFNFTSFMPPEHLQILRHKSSSNLRGIVEQKDHLKHQSPLSVVDDPVRPRHRRKSSWSKSFSKLQPLQMLKSPATTPKTTPTSATLRLPLPPQFTGADKVVSENVVVTPAPHDEGAEADNEDDEYLPKTDQEKTISERVQYWNPDRGYAELGPDSTKPTYGRGTQAGGLGTRLTMTSRTGFFNDRIISPSMMRAMAICYVGPRNSPDLSKNYYISPILTPSALLALYPPVYILCGERDPFSDDTLIFAGRLREAKLAKKAELTAKQNKFGEGLRMSSSLAAERPPILDETEEDWVTMRFIEGWSHGFMQMVTLLPKVKQFFDLTADWASYSFTKYEAEHPTIVPSSIPPVQPSLTGHESTSEKEEDVLSFKPRRRGSRTSSPVPPAGLKAQLKAEQAALSSSSSSDLSTAPTSIFESDSSIGKKRRPSPSDGTGKASGPVQRVLQQEFEEIPTARRRSSDVSPTRELTSEKPTPARRASDSLEKGLSGTAFVEAADLLQRRRDDAVHGLAASALITSDEEHPEAEPMH